MDKEPRGNVTGILLTIGVVLAILGAAGWLVLRAARERSVRHPYDESAVTTIDPALIRWEEVASLPTGLTQAVGLAIGTDGSLALAGDGRLRLLAAPQLHRLLTDEIAAAEPAFVDHPLPRSPSSLDADSAGGYLVGMGDRLLFCAVDGTPGAVWPSIGERGRITAAARFSEGVFVADGVTPDLYRLGDQGTSVRRIIGHVDQRKNWLLPLPESAIDLCVWGDVLAVVNPGQNQVEIFGGQGDYRQTIGRQGGTIDAFIGCHNPIAIAPLGDQLVTSEKGSQRIKVIDRQGGLVEVVAGPDAFSTRGDYRDIIDLAVDADGRILALDVIRQQVRVFARRADAPPVPTTSNDKE